MIEIHTNYEKLEIPVLTTLFTLYERTHTIIRSLPKFERYTLGEAMERTILETFDLIVRANTSTKYEKVELLVRANAKIEIAKLLYRIALNSSMLTTGIYLELERILQEAGKMTQGWIKYCRNAK